MSKEKKSRLNYHEEENAMVENLEDLKELGKEMEHISEKNDEEKVNIIKKGRDYKVKMTYLIPF